MPSIPHIFFTIVLIVMIVVVCLIRVGVNNYEGENDQMKIAGITPEMLRNPTLAFTTRGTTNEQSFRSNCDVETVYSMTDSHCQQICSTYNIQDGSSGNIYVSRHGICLNSKTVQRQDDTAAKENECNPKNGVLAYVTGDTQFGTLRHYCLSIDIGIQPNDGSTTDGNILCRNGEIDIDYTRAFPQLSNCKCADNEFLAIVPGTSTIRAHGTCVNNSARRIYELANLVHTGA